MLQRPCDRFIPIRNPRDGFHELSLSADKHTETSTNYSRILSPQSSKCLKFASTSPSKPETLCEFILQSLPTRRAGIAGKMNHREAIKILDAPEVVKNFYFNPLDWAPNNRIGIALTDSAYILCEGKEIDELDRCSSIPITCLKFHSGGDICLLGESTGRVEVYDTEKSKKVRKINIHHDRVGILQNSDTHEAFLSGSKDKLIKLNDLRVRKSDVATMDNHKGEICGLSVTRHYLASGGNDNKVVIWDLRKLQPINELREHKSAVKAIAWCPWKTNLLATGGGSQDRQIVLWNGNKNIVEARIETQSQVISVEWKEEGKQLISAHYSGKSGYCLLWSGKEVQLKLRGHKDRILGLKLNPENSNEACTIGADETIRFWNLKASCSPHQSTQPLEQSQNSLNYDFR